MDETQCYKFMNGKAMAHCYAIKIWLQFNNKPYFCIVYVLCAYFDDDDNDDSAQMNICKIHLLFYFLPGLT